MHIPSFLLYFVGHAENYEDRLLLNTFTSHSDGRERQRCTFMVGAQVSTMTLRIHCLAVLRASWTDGANISDVTFLHCRLSDLAFVNKHHKIPSQSRFNWFTSTAADWSITLYMFTHSDLEILVSSGINIYLCQLLVSAYVFPDALNKPQLRFNCALDSKNGHASFAYLLLPVKGMH